MSGDKGHLGAASAVGDRDAGIGRGRDGRGHSGHYLKGYAPAEQVGGLLAAPPEHKGIAALKAGDHLALHGQITDEPADILLAHGVVAALFAHIYALGTSRGQVQELGVGQIVIHHGVGLFQRPHPLQGEQFGIAGPRTHQIHFTRH